MFVLVCVSVCARCVCVCVSYLCERFGEAFQCKLVTAELTLAAVGGGEPVLQAPTVHHGQAARTLARGQQLPRLPSVMADPAERLLTAHAASPERDESE